MTTMDSQQFFEIKKKKHKKVQDQKIALDNNESIKLILNLMSSRFHIYDYNMVKDGFRVLNTLNRVNKKIGESDSYGVKWVRAFEDLSNIVAIDNALEWINSYNQLVDFFNQKHNQNLKKVELSCYLKECSEQDLTDTFRGASSLKKILNFRADLGRNDILLDDESAFTMNGKKYMEIFHRHFDLDDLEVNNIHGRFWTLLVPEIIRKFLLQSKIFFDQDIYRHMNRAFREGRIGSGHVSDFVDLSSTLLFPSKISQELVVYRLDTQNDTSRSFITKGYYSTSLRYESIVEFDKGDTPVRILRITIPQDTYFIPMFQHTGREGEVTLIPGTNLERVEKCEQIGKRVLDKKYLFCDYTVTRTTELSQDTKHKLFSRMISKILKLSESVKFTQHDYESELVGEIVNEFTV